MPPGRHDRQNRYPRADLLAEIDLEFLLGAG